MLRTKHIPDKKDFPFPENLLNLLRLDIWKYAPMIKDMEQALLRFHQTRGQQDADIVLTGLEKLAQAHIYFQQLHLDWQCRFEQTANAKGSALIDLPPRKDLTHIQKAIRLDENREDHPCYALRLGREGQGEKGGVRGGKDHAGGISGVAEKLIKSHILCKRQT